MKKTCFVITGYGVKTDFQTGKNYNLDNTYKNIIKPVFEELGFECFRAFDINPEAITIDGAYDWLLKADILIADITSLNVNVMYELGIRHSLNPRGTIVIADKSVNIPFNIKHLNINFYEHLGTDIGYGEVMRFKEHLKKIINEKLDSYDEIDSPIYNSIPSLQPPINK
jgi:hypothetical protein